MHAGELLCCKARRRYLLRSEIDLGLLDLKDTSGDVIAIDPEWDVVLPFLIVRSSSSAKESLLMPSVKPTRLPITLTKSSFCFLKIYS